ncbi:hypothetical protein I4J89_05745 [Actinoplanes sp. NEAU-A11]|uniref:Uncharacterized protein n=2 Tax=Actinoplanes aureus TaxID=2792083 RepID=A0A931C5R9_9ACTN|nr:hypothetical protein [Actinoplanes aureus]
MVTPKPPRKRGRLQSRRARLALALGAGMMALLCLGGVGVFIALYDEATEIKRTEPDAVVDSFLGAFLVTRDDNEAKLYQCDSGGDFTQLVQYRDDTVSREKEFSVGISITWSSLAVETTGANGNVGVDLIRTIAGQGGRDSSSWQIALVDQDGWRVCGATKV